MTESKMDDKKKYEEEGFTEWIELKPVEPVEEPPKKEAIAEKEQGKPPEQVIHRMLTEDILPKIEISKPVQLEIEKKPQPDTAVKKIEIKPEAVDLKTIEDKPKPIEPEEEKIDPRLERLMPKAGVDQHDVQKASVAVSTEEKKADLKPWEIDMWGRPLKAPPKEPTPYEKWFKEKVDKEGKAVECPKCGTINYDLAYVTGQKCKKCGFEIEEFENISEKMAEHDEEVGVFGATRLSTGFSDIGTNLRAILAIPGILLNDPIPPFEYVFKSSSAPLYLILSIAYIISFFFLLPLVFASSSFILNIILFIILIMVGISIFTGLGKFAGVTSIKVDNNGAVFSGWGSSTRIDYDEIISITNRRELNGMIEMTKYSKPVYNSILFIFFMIFFGFFFGFLLYWIYWFNFKAAEDPFFDVSVESSSSSRFYTNNISISTGVTSVSYAFCGAMNLQFVRALAIIIYMAKKANKKCKISPSAIRAAEKGSEHFSLWQQRYNV